MSSPNWVEVYSDFYPTCQISIALTNILSLTSYKPLNQNSNSQISELEELPIVVLSFQTICYSTMENSYRFLYLKAGSVTRKTLNAEMALESEKWKSSEEWASKRLKNFKETARTCLMNFEEDIGKGLMECKENVTGNWRKYFCYGKMIRNIITFCTVKDS